MRIVERVTPINSDKTLLGDRDIKLELDTDTGEMSIDTPAMFTNPIVHFSDLKDKIDKLAELQDQMERPPEPG